MLDDLTMLALCVWDEAAGELFEGKVAVATVVLKRSAAKFESDGTITGTVLHKDQFSGFWFSMQGHPPRYLRDAWTADEAAVKATRLFAVAQHQSIWHDCVSAAQEALTQHWSFKDANFDKLLAEPRAFMYANLAILPRPPAWASSQQFICKIGHHSFFKA